MIPNSIDLYTQISNSYFPSAISILAASSALPSFYLTLKWKLLLLLILEILFLPLVLGAHLHPMSDQSSASPIEHRDTLVPAPHKPPTISVPDMEISTDPSVNGDIRAIYYQTNGLILAMSPDQTTRLYYGFKLSDPNVFDTPRNILQSGKSIGKMTVEDYLKNQFPGNYNLCFLRCSPLHARVKTEDAWAVQDAFNKLTGSPNIKSAAMIGLPPNRYKDGDIIQVTGAFGIAVGDYLPKIEQAF